MVFMVKIDPAPILPLICGEHTPFPATSKTVAFEMDNGRVFQKTQHLVQ